MSTAEATEVPATTTWRDEAAISVDRMIDEHILPISRNGAYDAVRRGDIPSIRLRGRILIPVVPLRRMLGELS